MQNTGGVSTHMTCSNTCPLLLQSDDAAWDENYQSKTSFKYESGSTTTQDKAGGP